jgi:hypothetical protein
MRLPFSSFLETTTVNRTPYLFCLSFALLFATSDAQGYEQPAYEIIADRDGYEIRAYAPYLVAETTVPGDMDEAGSQAFRILAGYIFGNNVKAGFTAGPDAPSEAMNMTIPVTSFPVRSDTEQAQQTFQFVLERSYSMQTLPRPTDERVNIRQLPAQKLAVLRYSGRTTEKNFAKHKSELLRFLQRDGIETDGQARAAVYNGPFTLPFMRRNEVLIPVAPDS